MPTKIVDLSARSDIIRDEPFHVHFWECTPDEYRKYMGDPRGFLGKMGIVIPKDCRIETTIENHDWIGTQAPGMRSNNGTIICNVGGGNIARSVYRVVSYGHDHSTVAKYRKKLLHGVDEQEVAPKRKAAAKKSVAKAVSAARISVSTPVSKAASTKKKI